MPNLEELTPPTPRPPPSWSCKSIPTMVCLPLAKISGTSASIPVLQFSMIKTILTTDSISTSNSSQSSQFSWSPEESTTHMRWMRSRELECPITQLSQRIETFMASWAGSLTLMSSVQRIITLDMWVTESILMGQWITMWLSITQQWQTLNFLDRMLHPSLLQESEFKQCQSKTGLNMVLQWDLLKVLSRHLCMQLHSYSIETFQTNTKSMERLPKLNNSQTVSHSWDNLI